MDKFGYIRGRRGPPGPPGKNAVELHEWCPRAVLEMFRKDEVCTFYFNTEEDGMLIEESKATGLKDRFGKNNAICLKNIQRPIKVGKCYGIPLKDSLYKISNIETATTAPSICIIALQFKVSSKLSSEHDYIFTNETGTRGVTISKKTLNILGTDPLDLKYDYREWNSLVIQYSYTSQGDNKCFFTLNERQGFFIPHIPQTMAREVYIGGHQEGKDFASIILTNFEIYFKSYDSEPESYILPEEILKLIKYDLDDRIDPTL